MSQSEKMNKALLTYVIPRLEENGFIGEYPNYRRAYEDRVEIISFHPWKYGNAFYVDISTAYLRDSNNNLHNFTDRDINTVTTSDCNKIYRLKGNFDRKFFYTDVYLCPGAIFLGVSEKKAETYKRGFFDIRVQKSSPEIYIKVCDKINKQIKKAYKWWNKMSKR
ncbi:MAG: DUF4304 domain-containing protein [Roseburia sp.]|nr:DUF4304 domain-containing protein [Roseburia sp.]